MKKDSTGLKIISYYTGNVILMISLTMLIPIITSLITNELEVVLDFIITMSVSVVAGLSLIMYGWETKSGRTRMQWKHGLVVASLSWIFLMILCAVPYWLSGHVHSFLDAAFDVMSGFTTTGVVLTQDLDHLSLGLNMWRHMLTFIGGQGIIVLALSLLIKEGSGAYKLYVGEAKDVALVPNVKGTTKIIWKISMIYLVAGTFILWINGMMIGLNPGSAFLHGLFMFESAWSTGGFAPNTQNIMYYHSVSYEIITMVIFIIGSFNFGLHYTIWQGKRKEIIKNIETQSFFITSFIISMLAVFWLSQSNIYHDAASAFRRVVFNVLSAHTTTGLGSIYARQFALEWGGFGILLMVTAMLIGGSACSTAGGFKGLRVGVVFKGLIAEVKRLISSERNVKIYKFHHLKDYILDDAVIKSSGLIIICYMTMFAIGTAIGVFYGYPLADAAFESASVAGNVGLSIGITAPSMPALLKVYYIISMYLGRLEFLSVFALIGYSIGGIKKLCAKS